MASKWKDDQGFEYNFTHIGFKQFRERKYFMHAEWVYRVGVGANTFYFSNGVYAHTARDAQAGFWTRRIESLDAFREGLI